MAMRLDALGRVAEPLLQKHELGPMGHEIFSSPCQLDALWIVIDHNFAFAVPLT